MRRYIVRNSLIKYLTMSLVWTTGLVMGVPARAADKTPSPPYSLEFKGKVGQWTSEVAFELVLEYLESGKQVGSLADGSYMSFDEGIKEIRPNGNRIITNRATRVRQIKVLDGTTVSFDSNDPQELARAGSDPAMLPVLALLKTTASYERDYRGRMVGYTINSDNQAVNESVSETASDTMARDAMVFPAGPVTTGQSWVADKRDISYGALGSLQFTVKGTLTGVETRNMKTHALITFTAENPAFTATGNFRDLKLRDFSYTSSGEYDFDAGRMIVIEQNSRINLGSDNKDAPVIKAEVRASSRDTGTELTAWMVRPTPPLISSNPASTAPAGAERHGKGTRRSSNDPLPEWLPCFGPENTPTEQRLEACSLIIEAGTSHPGSVDTDNLVHAFYIRAMIHADLAEMDRALNDMGAVIRLKPDFEAFATRAEIYRHNGKYELAIADANHAISLDPSNVRIRLLKAFSHAKLGLNAEAIRDCNEAMLIAPEDASVYGVRGEIKIHAGDKAGGEADLAKAAALEKK
jgi:hypothetical protein